MKRKAYNYLLKWKDEGTKPLLIYGQRQVGKTYIITEFAKNNYEEYLYVDFSKDKEMRSVFRDYCTVESVIAAINTLRNVEIRDGSLLIFDEVQDCEEALSSLKQFAMDGRYDVIASGSMLGVMLDHSEKRPPLSPMGYAIPYLMRPLDFEEFLWSQGVTEKSIEYLRECINEQKPLKEAICDKFNRLFRLFMIVGGMPAAVNAFNTDRKTFNNAGEELESIIIQIERDINRYNDSAINKLKTAECFHSIPQQLAQTNKKFQYSRIDNDKNSRKAADTYKENLLWIKNAGYGNYIYALNNIALPITGNTNPKVFKIYLSDTGMLTHMYGDPAVSAIFSGDLKYNLGAITENAVADSLVKCNYVPTYYQKRSGTGQMEIDFVIETFDGLVAIEVKSGKDRESPSLDKVDNHFKVDKKVKLEEGDIYVDEDGVIHLPLFAAAFLDSLDHVPEYMG